MTATQALWTVLIIAGVTLLTRALPFLLFPAGKATPPFMRFLGQALPYAIIGMLVVYCLKDTAVQAAPHGLPEAVGICAVAALYLWKRNTLLAIAGGTALYMLLVQLVFAP